jgi:hypothetical protein
MSSITYPRASPVRPQAGVIFHRIRAQLSDRTRPIVPHLKAAGSILFFTAIMAVLLGTKAAVMLSRMHGG